MAVNLFIPYVAVAANGNKTITSAPTVDALPTSPLSVPNVVLTVTVGAFIPGAYQWVISKNRWQFIVDYQTICSQLFGISTAYVCTPNAGDNLLPVGDAGAAVLKVTRNGAVYTDYTKLSMGLALGLPATASDIYLVIMQSAINATTSLIADAPGNGNAYVRKNLTWSNVLDETNEGFYVGS